MLLEKHMRTHWERMKECGAVWEYPDDPRSPHVVLRRGKHSNGFIDTIRFLSLTRQREAAAQTISGMVRERFGSNQRIDNVFGSPMGSVHLVGDVAHGISAKRTGILEKKDGGFIVRTPLEPGETALIVEELVTTGETPRLAKEAIKAACADVVILPVVFVFLSRCKTNTPATLPGMELDPVISTHGLGIEYAEWEPNDCQLCAVGSEPIQNPKLHWLRLMRTMKEYRQSAET